MINPEQLRELEEEAEKERSPFSKFKPLEGPASTTLRAIYHTEGYVLALQAQTPQQFVTAYTQLVIKSSGPYDLKQSALEGALAAVNLGLSKLTRDDITETERAYKSSSLLDFTNPLQISRRKRPAIPNEDFPMLKPLGPVNEIENLYIKFLPPKEESPNLYPLSEREAHLHLEPLPKKYYGKKE